MGILTEIGAPSPHVYNNNEAELVDTWQSAKIGHGPRDAS